MRSRLGNSSVLPTSKKMTLSFEFMTTRLNHYSESKVAVTTGNCRAAPPRQANTGLDGGPGALGLDGRGRPSLHELNSFGRLRLRQALGDDTIHRRIKCHSDVSARDFKVDFRIPGHAIAPVHDAVIAGVNRGLEHRVRNVALQRVHKIAGAAPGVAGGQYSWAMLLQDSLANAFGSVEN